jgi:hypothetical protein
MQSITIERLKEISALSESVPEPFRLKCFELLLAHSLTTDQPPKGKEEHPKGKEQKSDNKSKAEFILPIDIKAFLNQYSFDETILHKLFMIEGSEIRPIYRLDIHKKAQAQMAYALLIALENAMLSGEFKFTIEALRQRCTDQKCYDGSNFMTILERNKGFYKSYDPKKDLFLSPDGKAELANILEQYK